jgi:hypothetical protein
MNDYKVGDWVILGRGTDDIYSKYKIQITEIENDGYKLWATFKNGRRLWFDPDQIIKKVVTYTEADYE